MKALKCDRCGGYFDNKNHVTISEVVEDNDKKSSTVFYQLCPSCESTFLSWLHNEKGEEVHTTYADDLPIYSYSKEVAAELGIDSTANASESRLFDLEKEMRDLDNLI